MGVMKNGGKVVLVWFWVPLEHSVAINEGEGFEVVVVVADQINCGGFFKSRRVLCKVSVLKFQLK